MAVHKDRLLKQLNEAMEFEQHLHEELVRQLEKEKNLIREKEDLMLQLSEVCMDGETTQHISFFFADKLLSEKSNDKHNNILHLVKKQLVVTDRSTKWHNSVLDTDITERIPEGEAFMVDNPVQKLKYIGASYICPICSTTFTIEDNLRRHVRKICCQASYLSNV